MRYCLLTDMTKYLHNDVTFPKMGFNNCLVKLFPYCNWQIVYIKTKFYDVTLYTTTLYSKSIIFNLSSLPHNFIFWSSAGNCLHSHFIFYKIYLPFSYHLSVNLPSLSQFSLFSPFSLLPMSTIFLSFPLLFSPSSLFFLPVFLLLEIILPYFLFPMAPARTLPPSFSWCFVFSLVIIYLWSYTFTHIIEQTCNLLQLLFILNKHHYCLQTILSQAIIPHHYTQSLHPVSLDLLSPLITLKSHKDITQPCLKPTWTLKLLLIIHTYTCICCSVEDLPSNTWAPTSRVFNISHKHSTQLCLTLFYLSLDTFPIIFTTKIWLHIPYLSQKPSCSSLTLHIQSAITPSLNTCRHFS